MASACIRRISRLCIQTCKLFVLNSCLWWYVQAYAGVIVQRTVGRLQWCTWYMSWTPRLFAKYRVPMCFTDSRTFRQLPVRTMDVSHFHTELFATKTFRHCNAKRKNYLLSAQCWSTVQWFGTTVCPRPSVKVWKLYSAAPFVSSSQLLLACHIFLLWATHKFHLSTLAVKKLINDFSGTCLTLPLVFSPYCHHPETAQVNVNERSVGGNRYIPYVQTLANDVKKAEMN